MSLKENSLVLYKSRPAIVRHIEDKKLTIELADGESVSVRPKDVLLLHPGPSPHPRQLKSVVGDPLTAWELLQGEETTIADLAELAFGEFTPGTAWTIWQLVADGVYFEGTPDAVKTHTPAKAQEIQAARESKISEEREWEAFVSRIAQGDVLVDDEKYLADVIALALGRTESSRTLRRLDKPQTPEAAHELLLHIGRWLPADNPYPTRLNVATSTPVFPIHPLPDEPRRDLTHLLSLAIDDEGSGDPDDAISIDGDIIWVHVADVGAMIPPDSAADVEARNRAANLYVPEGTIRMLPDGYTNQLALGLQPVSPALSFALARSGSSEFTLTEVVPSWIRVTRTTYESAETQLDTDPFPELLHLAEVNRAHRIARGAIELELPEVKLKASIDGRVIIRPLLPLRSRGLVRELMLMTGEATGRYGMANGLPLVYTAQEPPSEDSSLPPDLTGASPSIMYAQRRLMQRSRQSLTPGRHAGLGLDVYVQVTSPLRRYLDLLVHQQLRAHLAGRPPLEPAEVMLRIGTTDAIAGAVRSAERLSNQHWTLVYLMQNQDWRGIGVVVENRPGRDTVLIPDLAWETDIYQRPSRPLDSTLMLAVDSIDLANRSARFRVTG